MVKRAHLFALAREFVARGDLLRAESRNAAQNKGGEKEKEEERETRRIRVVAAEDAVFHDDITRIHTPILKIAIGISGESPLTRVTLFRVTSVGRLSRTFARTRARISNCRSSNQRSFTDGEERTSGRRNLEFPSALRRFSFLPSPRVET